MDFLSRGPRGTFSRGLLFPPAKGEPVFERVRPPGQPHCSHASQQPPRDWRTGHATTDRSDALLAQGDNNGAMRCLSKTRSAKQCNIG